MRLQHILIPAALCSLVAASAYSEETDHYRLEKSANGYVRMDTRTGAMSICEERTGQLVCKMAADERAAYQDEIDRLDNSVKALDARVAKLENSLSARLESRWVTWSSSSGPSRTSSRTWTRKTTTAAS